MQTIQNTPEKLVLRADVNESLANAVRRSISEIKTLAIDEVEIFKNDSALFDEVLVHRLGLVALRTDKKMSDKTKIDLKLSKKGPCIVYAGDLSGSADIIFEKTPITILGETHKLELIATAKLGIGKEHAKHIPGLCYYRYILEVASSPEIDEIIKNSKGEIKPEKKGSKWICDLNDAEVNKIQEKHKEAVTNTNELILIIESYGNMPAKEILMQSVKALELNLTEFEKEIK